MRKAGIGDRNTTLQVKWARKHAILKTLMSSQFEIWDTHA